MPARSPVTAKGLLEPLTTRALEQNHTASLTKAATCLALTISSSDESFRTLRPLIGDRNTLQRSYKRTLMSWHWLGERLSLKSAFTFCQLCLREHDRNFFISLATYVESRTYHRVRLVELKVVDRLRIRNASTQGAPAIQVPSCICFHSSYNILVLALEART